ncbi:hypothetical protein ANMWB30_24960 [Arthrobacter sp. MWB30]|nr:hypothetical protein ANMWB30_24960 [Arthrobacter sp. MWB30]
MSKYPECEKLAAISHQSQMIGDFLAYLAQEGIQLGRFETVYYATTDDAGRSKDVPFDDPRFTPLHGRNEHLMAEYFGIDLQKVEKEKAAMLAGLHGES